jgi:hypothetical protein
MNDKNPITQSIDWLVECGWSKEQATHLASAIKADTPEQLWAVAPLWLEHCGGSMKYVNDMLGSVAMGLIEVTQGADGEWLFKLNDAGMGVGKQLNEDQP